MKRLIVFFIIATLSGCDQKDNGFDLNPNLIEPFFRNDYLNIDNPDFEYVKVESFNLDLNGNDKPDSIVLRKVNNWNDPGDFHQVEITLDNGQKIVETNFQGWVKFGENYPVNNELQQLNKVTSDKILIADFYTDKKLIFVFGWVYASEPGLLTIFDVNGNQPKIVFNDNFKLNKLNHDSFNGRYGEKESTIKLINNKFEL